MYLEHFFCQTRSLRTSVAWLYIVVLTVTFLWIPANAQNAKSHANWYFGSNAGVTFNAGTPQALTNGKLNAAEGCASISDANGQLLFYTDGSTIWNRNHDVMPGATDLGGNSQSTQSALIVPYQKSTALFYVFSVARQNQQTGIQYALVDMNMEGGLGGLTVKNKPLISPSTEKITTINHCNNLNHWILTHETGSNTFRVNLLNDNGVIATPAFYKVGSAHQSQQNKGYMKPSHDGKKLAVAVSDSVQGGFLEVFDFDNKTGAISNSVKLESPETVGAYGVEFSPDDKFIYLSTMFSKTIYQIAVDGLTINAKLPVQSQSNVSKGIGALQIGPDNKIYGTQPGEEFLIATNQPNQLGTGCGLVSQAVGLGGRTAMAGLPFNADTIQKLPPKVTITLKKLDGCNKFLLASKTENLDTNYLLYQWYANGMAVTGANSSTLLATKSGTYLLKVRETKCLDIQITSDQILPVVVVDANPTVRLIPDLCGTFFLNAHATGGTVRWTGFGITSPRSQLDSLTISGIRGTQTYHVRVSNPDDSTCFADKDVTATFSAPSSFKLAEPTRTICGDTLAVQAVPTSDWNMFSWHFPDGSMAKGTTVVARQSGQYHVIAFSTNSGCKSDDTLTVTLNPVPKLRLGVHKLDTCFAQNGYLELDAGLLPDVLYNWTTKGTTLGTSQLVKASTYGTYAVTVRTPAGCQASDSVRIVSICPPTIPAINVPDSFTPNQDGINDRLVVYGSGADHMNLTIYDRWGELLYKATDGVSSLLGWTTWDGMVRGQPVVSGLYVYKLEIKSTDFPDLFIKKGVIQIIR